MDVSLKVLEGAKSGTKIAVKKTEFIIGRSQDCHLCAGSSAVSRQHCAILRTDNRVSIKDLGSRNGTIVNGNKTLFHPQGQLSEAFREGFISRNAMADWYENEKTWTLTNSDDVAGEVDE
jgi:predicted component of type VI protein secretion system